MNLTKGVEFMSLTNRVLNNFSQVILIENKWTGLSILIAIAIADWQTAVCIIITSLLSIYLGPYFKFSKEQINIGVAGYNPILTTLALSAFLTPSLATYILMLISIPVTLFIHKVMEILLNRIYLSVYTMPFILTSWVMINNTNSTQTIKTNLHLLPSDIDNNQFPHIDLQAFNALFNGYSEIFLVSGAISGILILVGIFFADKILGLLTLISCAIGIVIIMVMEGNMELLNHGLFGYNIILLMIVVWGLYKNKKEKYIILFSAIILEVLLNLALITLFKITGLPVLTVPFVLLSWMIKTWSDYKK